MDVSGRVHLTDLKRRLLAGIPGLQAHKQGRDVLLAFNDDVGSALKQVYENDFDDEAMILLRATNIIRRDILSTSVKFDGTFHTGCQQDSVPDPLKTFLRIVLGGPNITMQFSNMIEAQTTLTLAQLVIFNMIKCRSKGTTSSYHSTDREPPLPIYLGLMLHAETRKRDLIDKLYGLGLSVSYDRVLALSTEMGNKACAQFESDGVVCPIRLRKGYSLQQQWII